MGMVFTNFKHGIIYDSLALQKCITPWEHSKSEIGVLGQILRGPSEHKKGGFNLHPLSNFLPLILSHP